MPGNNIRLQRIILWLVLTMYSMCSKKHPGLFYISLIWPLRWVWTRCPCGV